MVIAECSQTSTSFWYQHLLSGLLFLSLDWTGLDEDEDAHVWEDNWDDDNVEDDFSNQLR
uniref:26S proteasome complex subunit SEM1 n=1 Tax=Pavo cristatus TaxID=9049 RepID=A0A8C9ENG9_PAVCR